MAKIFSFEFFRRWALIYSKRLSEHDRGGTVRRWLSHAGPEARQTWSLLLLPILPATQSDRTAIQQLSGRVWKVRRDRVTSDAMAATKVALHAVIVLLEMSEALPGNKIFFDGLQGENVWQRLARQDHNKARVEEYGKLLDEAYRISVPGIKINLELSIHRLHVESVALDRKEHARFGSSFARSPTKVLQQYLRNELRAAQERIVDIQNSERRTSTSRSTRSARVARSLRLFSGRGASDTRSRDPEMGIREMAARIRELEAELESPWARGLSDEPPPGYSEAEA
ncbi:hypothetical protein B0H13DRAFT_1867783 [Mycena leptocephala]|nr:hypothetical protein B0H13DRAFT_1867783 [Mycena leptocephala]